MCASYVYTCMCVLYVTERERKREIARERERLREIERERERDQAALRAGACADTRYAHSLHICVHTYHMCTHRSSSTESERSTRSGIVRRVPAFTSWLLLALQVAQAWIAPQVWLIPQVLTGSVMRAVVKSKRSTDLAGAHLSAQLSRSSAVAQRPRPYCVIEPG